MSKEEDYKPAAAQEAVAWFTDDHLSDKSATTYDASVAERWSAKGWPVTPLYATTPVAAAPVEFDRARETPRRQTAVEAMLAMGFVWGDGAWRAQSGGDMQDERNRWFIRAGEYLKRAQAAEAKLTSSPAAPGTDLEQFRDCVTTTRAIALQTMSNALNRCAESAAADAKRDIGECDRLLALIDASPKGRDGYITLQRRDVQRLLDGEDNSSAYVISHGRIRDCMQATSAEVGA